MALEKNMPCSQIPPLTCLLKRTINVWAVNIQGLGDFIGHNVSEKNCMIQLAVGRTMSSDLSQVSWFCSFSNSMYSCYLTFCQSSGKVCQTKVLNVTCTDCWLPFTAWTFYEVLHGWPCFVLFFNVFHKRRILKQATVIALYQLANNTQKGIHYITIVNSCYLRIVSLWIELLETKKPEFIYRSYVQMKGPKEFGNSQYACCDVGSPES